MKIERDQVKTLVVIGALIGAFVVGFWLPGRLRQGRLQRQIVENEAVIEMAQPDGMSLSGLVDRVVRLSQEAQSQEQAVPVGPELAPLLKELSLALEAIGAVDIETETGTSLQAEGYAAIPVTQNFKAPFAAVFDYLQRVEKTGRLLRVLRLSANRYDKSGDGMLAVHINLAAFYLPGEVPR